MSKFEKGLKLKKVQYCYLDLLFGSNPRILTGSEFERRFDEDPKWNVQEGETNLDSRAFK